MYECIHIHYYKCTIKYIEMYVVPNKDLNSGPLACRVHALPPVTQLRFEFMASS